MGAPRYFGGPDLANRKGSATKLDGASVTEAQVRMGFATGQANAAGALGGGSVASMGVRFKGDGP